MTLYRYKAVNGAGESVLGDFDAPSEAQVVEHLRDRSLMPVRIDLASESNLASANSGSSLFGLFSRKVISSDQLLAVTREIATLLRAGLPLDRTLQVMIELAEAPSVAKLLQEVRDDVRGGRSFSQALEARGSVFSRFYVNLVRAGEAGGSLGTVMSRLAESLERNKELQSIVVSAMIYPVVLMVVTVASVMLLLIKVVPQFTQMFQDGGQTLPWHTQLIVDAGSFLQEYWWVVIIFVVLLAMWWRNMRSNPKAKRLWDGRFLRSGRLGDLLLKIEVTRFARTLGTLLASGVSLLNGLGIVRETLSNLVLADAVEEVARKLREGKGMGKPLQETGLFPKLAVNMVQVGEESGQLQEMLLRVADVYDKEVKNAVDRFLALLQPVLIIVLALVIGGIVLSIMTTMMSVYDTVGS